MRRVSAAPWQGPVWRLVFWRENNTMPIHQFIISSFTKKKKPKKPQKARSGNLNQQKQLDALDRQADLEDEARRRRR